MNVNQSQLNIVQFLILCNRQYLVFPNDISMNYEHFFVNLKKFTYTMEGYYDKFKFKPTGGHIV